MADPLEVLRQVERRLEEVAERTRPIPEATPPGTPRRITVGMAVYEDYDGVFFTVEALHLYQHELAEQVEFIVLDNHPEGPDADALKRLDRKVPGLRYVPFRGYHGTAVRELVFREAQSDLVLCVDSHVLLRSGALGAIVAHLDEHPRDLVHGPLLVEDGAAVYATHFEEQWRDGMWGTWADTEQATDPAAPPFEIPMSGLGTFACRRDMWPGLNPRFRGFGGEEGYLHEKLRRLGGRVVCLPAAGYVHRFTLPRGPAYHNAWDDRVRNYFIAWHELGLDTRPIERHFREFLGRELANPMIDKATREIENPFSVFDAIMCIQLDRNADKWPDVQRRFEAIGMGRMVERFPAFETKNHHEGCARSHRAVVAEARRRGLRNVLVCEEDVIFSDDALAVAGRALDELAGHEWDLLYLGAHHQKPQRPLEGATALDVPTRVTTTHAIAYNESAFDQILADVPEDDATFAEWIERHGAIDQYLPNRTKRGVFRAFVVSPRIAAQPWMMQYEDAEQHRADHYRSAM